MRQFWKEVFQVLKEHNLSLQAIFIGGFIYVFALCPVPEDSMLVRSLEFLSGLFQEKKEPFKTCYYPNIQLNHYKTTNNKKDHIILCDSVRISGDPETTRLEKLSSMLTTADSSLTARGHEPYGETLMPYFNHPDKLGKVMLDALAKRSILHMEEDFIANQEENTCYYKVSLGLEVNGASDVARLNSLAAEEVRIAEIVDSLVVDPLNEKQIAKVTSLQVYQILCLSCPCTESVCKMTTAYNSVQSDNIYFEKSEYDLDVVSKMILLVLQNRLQEKFLNNISVEFHGYTDSSAYTQPTYYTGGAYISTSGTLLNDSPNKTNAQKLQMIKSNEQLSFARAYSCYEFIKSQPTKNNTINYSYTGRGVSEEHISDKEKRSVRIIVRKN